MENDDAASEASVPVVGLRKSYTNPGQGPLLFPIITITLLTLFTWSIRWILSGAASLTYCLILGAHHDSRILPFIPMWTQIALLNLTYLACATSWLFYWVFALSCYPAIFLVCLFQFDTVARLVRRQLSHLLKSLHFINDKIAFFNIPALEIDTEVEGLLVIRGITISLSHLSVTAHGVEVGIKLSEDMELAIQVDEVKVLLFRRIEIGDCYANLKGGIYEMTFGKLAKRDTGDGLMVSDTPLLEAAALKGNTTRPDFVRMTSKLTHGIEPHHVSVKDGLQSISQISPDDSARKYRDALAYIHNTSSIQENIKAVLQALETEETSFEAKDENGLRAAVCSQLHEIPSVPHPPLASVKVTTLQNGSPEYVRRFLHRLPFLLRLLLNPISYFHPIKITSITAAASGKWLQHTLHHKLFKHYAETDSGLRKLERRVSTWLTDANFVLQMVDITGLAQVPMNTNFDINTSVKIDDVMAFRTQAGQIDLKEVVRLGGADATIQVPSFLLPHHEHLMPALPTAEDVYEQEKEVEEADNIPKEVQAKIALKQTRKDETNVKLSVHGRLPAVFDQELLDFIAALVKAAKIIEMEKEPDLVEETLEDSEVLEAPTKRSLRDIAREMKTGMKEGMKTVNEGMRRVGIDAVANDRFIAKMVGKITKKLETALGDIGYSGDLPVALGPYRARAETASKLLP
ncbi:hypothetical protein EJ08DRAFT_624654 [Tothia fuscella]|uniref:Uncharacterized protein n=1 Tax=Tothia fuscella TaxID=1048955 RepID=A0A9P4U3M9_9PEZI|nr:hypothetical protein EJ08DRAFT_624654 [Tothia fuscella]